MAVNVIMPAMGATQETGRLVRWFKQQGDSVTRGEMLMEVETDKSVVEVEAPASGTLLHVTAAPDDDIPVGQTIAIIIEPGEGLPKPAKSTAQGRKGSAPVRRAGRSAASVAGTQTGRPLASPAAKRLAKEKGLDLAGVTGTGPQGAVVARDVLSAVAPAPASVSGTVRLSRMRQVISERMTLSKQTAPHFYLNMDVDMTGVEARRNALKQHGAGPAPSINDFILSAVSRALAESPSMNAAWTDEGVEQFGEVNLGMAVAVDDGLVVPVIRNADKLDIDQLGQRSSELAGRAQSRRLKPADYQGGTFTVSNLGMFGVDSFVAIINPPQSGILAVGRVAPRVVPDGEGVAVRSMMTMTLSADHRVVDGAIGARFLQRVKQHLEEL